MHLFPLSTNSVPTRCPPPQPDARAPEDRIGAVAPRLPQLDLRVVLLVVGVALGGQLAGQLTVAWGTGAVAEADTRSRMALGFSLLQSAAIAEQSRLSVVAGNLSRDRGTRAALASGSRVVADGALRASLARSGVRYGALLAADGTLVAGALPEGTLDMAPLLRHARGHGELRSGAVIGERAYLLAIEPVERPGVAAWALTAEALDAVFAAARAAGVSVRVADDNDGDPSPYRIQRTLAMPTGALQLVLERDAHDAARPFAAMRHALAAVGALVVLGALLAGLAIARSRRGAIAELLQAVARIRHGDYGRPPAVAAGTDLAALARSFVRMQSSIAAREARLAQQARQSALAALAGQDEAHANVEAAIHAARAGGTPVTLMALGIGDFTKLASSLAPAAIEDLLGELARRLVSEARAADSVTQLGRGDFLVVLRDTDVEGAAVMARRLAAACSRPVALEGGTVALDLAAGIAVYPEHGDDAHSLVTRASRALRVAEQVPERVYAHEPAPEEAAPLRASA